jgi:hypothetical protein
MRAEFLGYFEPSERDLSRLWKNAVIALDTNVLLGLYRMPEASRKEILAVLRSVGERLWVPYHVLVEYHSNRLTTLREEFEAAEKMERDFRDAFMAFKAVVTNEKVTKRACWNDLSEKFNEIEAKAKELYAIAKKERANYIAPSQDDEIRDFLESLLAGRVGPRPLNQEAVNSAEAIAAERYQRGLGPGHLDGKKDGTHLVDGLIYNRQYGDYMVWAGLLDHCRSEKVQAAIFVTSDVKDDWWLDTRGKAGKKPQPELVMEMRREAGVRDFGMYTLSTFVANAKNRLKLKVNDQTITDALQAEHVEPKRTVLTWASLRAAPTPKSEVHSGAPDELTHSEFEILARAMDVKVHLMSVIGSVGTRVAADGSEEQVLVAGVNMLSSSKKPIVEAMLRRMKEAGMYKQWTIYFVPDPGNLLIGRASFVEEAANLISPYVPQGTGVRFHLGKHTGPGRLDYVFEEA